MRRKQRSMHWWIWVLLTPALIAGLFLAINGRAEQTVDSKTGAQNLNGGSNE